MRRVGDQPVPEPPAEQEKAMTTVNEDWEFGEPAGLGDQFQAAENIGKLVAFVEPQRVETTTRFGVQQATQCRYVVDITSDLVYDQPIIFGNLSKDAFSNGDAQTVLGVVVQGEPKPGQNPPFYLDPANPEQVAEAKEWFGKNAVKNAQGRILIG